jgi:acetyl-CoA acyltransferase
MKKSRYTAEQITGILKEIGLIELNEAFVVQALAVIRGLGRRGNEMAPGRMNVIGGAIALGHPFGCQATKLNATLLS